MLFLELPLIGWQLVDEGLAAPAAAVEACDEEDSADNPVEDHGDPSPFGDDSAGPEEPVANPEAVGSSQDVAHADAYDPDAGDRDEHSEAGVAGGAEGVWQRKGDRPDDDAAEGVSRGHDEGDVGSLLGEVVETDDRRRQEP